MAVEESETITTSAGTDIESYIGPLADFLLVLVITGVVASLGVAVVAP